MGDATWIVMIQGRCAGTIQLCSTTKPSGHGILGVRPFFILTNSPNPGGEGWLKPTLDRLDPTVKTAADNKCSFRGCGAAWLLGTSRITCGCWKLLCQISSCSASTRGMLEPFECRISRGFGLTLSLLWICKDRPIVGRLPDWTRGQNHWVQSGEMAKEELAWTYYT